MKKFPINLSSLKNFLVLILLFLICAGVLFANDGAYYMSGNQLIPIKNTNIQIQKEVLTIKKVSERYAQVNVYYEFLNSDKEQDVVVGFEALTPGGAADGRPKNGEHPNMKEFIVMVNDSNLSYSVAIVDNKAYLDSGLLTQVSEEVIRESGKYYNDVSYFYVYHFKARFKKGVNIVRHSYMFDLSNSVDFRFVFDYKLTASKSWGNGTIKDFTLILDFGEFEEFGINTGFFSKVDEWTMSGIGSMKLLKPDTYSYWEEKYLSVIIQKGVLVYQKKDFVPTENLIIWAWRYLQYEDFFDYSDSVSLPFPIVNQYRIAPPLDVNSQRILLHLPYARRGCVFEDSIVQAYYNSQDWYKPNPQAIMAFDVLTLEEQLWLEKTASLVVDE